MIRNIMRPPNITVRSLAPATQSAIVSDATLEIVTSEPLEFVDLTDHINEYLYCNNIRAGGVTVFSRHTTAAIKINEAEELLIKTLNTF